MSTLSKKIQIYLGRKPKFGTEVKLQDDGSGPYIKEWNISSEKAKPTDSQLTWQEQFEMIYKDQKNGTSTYKDHCDKVRSDNPKE
jgi:topoisomerase IA-like protein